MDSRWVVVVAVLVVACGVASCRSSDGDDKRGQELRFEMGDTKSAFRDLGKRAASGLE